MRLSPACLVLLSRWGLAAALLGISWLAFSSQSTPNVGLGYDKLNHAFAFFTLFLLLDNAFPARHLLKVKLGLLLGYGIFIEIVQGFVGREPSLLDVAADMAGMMLYWLLRCRLHALVSKFVVQQEG